MDILGESIKKIMLAGVGAVAISAEKSKEILDELVKKGELTVEQGKVLNEELKHNMKEAVKKAVQEEDNQDLLDKLKSMTPEELEKIKEALQKMEEKENDSEQE